MQPLALVVFGLILLYWFYAFLFVEITGWTV